MLIRKVTISIDVKNKIYEKHNVTAKEVEDIFCNNNPIFRRVSADQYLTIGLWNRYITIYFRYDDKTKEARITTAYPSSKKEIGFYKKNK